jgi:hypothetical protein
MTPEASYQQPKGKIMTKSFKNSLLRTISIVIPLCLCCFVSGRVAVAQNEWTTNGTHIYKTNTGNVGIGTSNPQDALHILNTTTSVGALRLQGGNTYAGFVGMWDGAPLLILANNRNPSTGNNYNTSISGAQLSLWDADFSFAVTSSGTVGNWSEIARLKGNGNFGLGTSDPAYKLDVVGVIRSRSGGFMFPDGTVQTTAGGSQWTTSSTNIFYAGGNVGIGTATPAVRLSVAGDARFTGSLTVDGNIAAKYQDVAEWVPADEQLAAGTVVVLDATKPNHVISSNASYDTLVAGVISEQPGITLGEKSDNKVLVATTGRVKVKVDATSGPIQIGDLLVTSDRAGFAMKSLPVEMGGSRMHRPGTLIGKALEPLAKGTGEILVLLSLQ